ncbi:MAG: DUF3320 domain-containing protein, partial [Thermomicrobiales bacterium]|nr:DUF3320 domain-containing protein [Thermomicrobiales bacterium]
ARTQELTIDDDVPALPIPTNWPAQTTPEAVARIRSLLNTLTDVADNARPASPHAWGFIDAGQPSRLNRDAILAAARAFDAGIAELPDSGSLAEVLRSIRQPEALTALSAVLNAPELDRIELLDEVRTAGWSQRADLAVRELKTFGDARSPVSEQVTPEVLKLDLGDIDRQAREAAASGFFGRKGRLKAAAERLAPALKPGARIDPGHLAEFTGPLASIGGMAKELRSRIEALPGLTLAPDWNPLLPEHRQWVEQRILWLRWSASLVDPNGPADRADFVHSLRAFYAQRPAIDRVTAQRIALVATAAQTLIAETAATSDELAAWSGEAGVIARWRETALARRLNDATGTTLRDWFELLEWVEPLRDERLLEARRALLTGVVPADDAVRSFARGVAEASRLERAESTGLEPFDDRAHERRIRQFVEASGAIRRHLVTAIPREVVATRSFDPTAEAGRVGRLTRELNRQRGGMGVRTLLDTFGDLITAIMPCVLVSPDSVARFFPAKSGLFDIVVFDEASQIRVADAIGAMGRGKSVVVVGDSKQMPPTAFAEPTTMIDEAVDGDTAEDEESILTECVNAQVPRHWLSWHYRSQDEALIAFSNEQYYEQKLSSFPAPLHGTSDPGPNGHGISLVRVDGVFHRNRNEGPHRTNPIEANAIVDEIERRFATSPDRAPSIGVVTFNIQQRNYIEELLRDRGNQRMIEALDDPDGLFVKNLENVQGDERDAIFFSTAFSVNDRGVLPLNFGPLNRAGGERRLNVAITRARRQVVVFSSFDPEQLRAEETSSVGVKHLRAYLDIAAHGTRPSAADGRSRHSVDRHREEIAEGLRERGYSVKTDVGLSEFRIDLVLATADQPDRPVMAMLLDGEAWAARRTVGDRDGLPQDVLTRMLGWPAVERIWMPAWLAERDTELDEIERAFEAALERIESGRPAPVVTEEPEPEPADDLEPAASSEDDDLEELRTQFASLGSAPVERQANASESFEEPLRAWEPRRLGGVEVLDLLPAARQKEKVAKALREVVEIEGPVHYDRLTRAVASAFELHRVNGARQAAILAALPRDLSGGAGESFAWPARLDRTTWRGYRRSAGGHHRPIDQICREEISNAMAAIAYGAAGIDREELKRETLALFGGRRLTPAIEATLAEALHFGLTAGRLAIDDSGVIRRGDNW